MATKQFKTIAIDSCVLIDILQAAGTKKEGDLVAPIMKAAEADELMLVISTMAIVELTKAAGVEPKNQRETIVAFLENDYFEVHAVNRSIAQQAQDLRRDHPLDPVDAVHVATAITTNTHLLLSRDGDGRKQRRKILPLDNKLKCLDGTNLRIMTLKAYIESEDAKSSPLLYAHKVEETKESTPKILESQAPTLRLTGASE